MIERVEHLAEGVSLYLGDCHTILPTLARADAVVTDPPYGINANTKTKASGRVGSVNGRHGGDPRLKDWPAVYGDGEAFDPTPWLAYPVAVLFGANHFSDRLPPATRWLVWDKRRGGTSDDNADCEIAWSNAKGPARLFSHLWRGMVRDSETQDPRWHPTQKPIAVMEWVLNQTTAPGQVILDPYMGSGTTGCAAVKTGRRFTGIEVVPEYFDVARRRISEALARPDLFVDRPVRPEPLQLALGEVTHGR